MKKVRILWLLKLDVYIQRDNLAGQMVILIKVGEIVNMSKGLILVFGVIFEFLYLNSIVLRIKFI